MAPRREDPELLISLLDHAPAVIMLVDAEVNIRWVNKAAAELFGFGYEDLGRNILEFLDPDWDPEAFESIGTAMGGSGLRMPMVFRVFRADGSRVIVEVTADVQLADPVLQGMVVYARIWDERYLLDQALEAMASSEPLDETLRLLVLIAEAETLDARAAILHDRVGSVFWGARVSDGLDRVLVGPTVGQPDEVLAAWAPIVAEPAGRVHTVDDLPAVLRGPAAAAGFRTLWVWPSEARGDAAPSVTAVAWRREDHLDVDQTRRQAMARIARIAGLVLERVRSEEATAYAASHDRLTGLANRARCYEVLDDALAESSTGVGVIYLDLDGFKPINDELGHGRGDEVLVEVSRRIRETARSSSAALAARLGGDEFVVVMTDVDQGRLEALASELVAAVAEPIELAGGTTVKVGTSAGIAIAGADVDSDVIVESADAALYEAKRAGGGTVRVGPLRHPS